MIYSFDNHLIVSLSCLYNQRVDYLGTGILSFCSPKVNVCGAKEEAVGMRTSKLRSFMRVPGCVTLRQDWGHPLDFSQPQIPSLQKKVALNDPLRCLPALMFCNSNEHSENGDWLQPAHCLEAWCLTHFSMLLPSSNSTGIWCWCFSPLKMCLLSWISGLPWGHFYQALSESMVLLSLHCSKELIRFSEWASKAVEKGLLCPDSYSMEQRKIRHNI